VSDSPADLAPRRPAMPPIAVGVAFSIVLHGALLALSFTFPEAAGAVREKALDIILVNAKSARKPTEAQALAQANLDGGGQTDDNRRAKTPLPPTRQEANGADLQQMQRRVRQLEATQQAMLTQAKSQQTVASQTASEQPTPPNAASGADLREAALAMVRLEGEISRQTEEYNKRPRKKFLGARAEEYGLAAYLDAWKEKVERIGTLNYPEAARGKLYGAVVIYVELNATDGSIFSTEISRSSGYPVLDQAALRILRMAAPFGPVPREPLAGATVLSFARTWYFTQGDALSTAR